MPNIIVTSRAGQQITLEAQSGMTVMEIIRDASVDEPFALCGGACSCATCHVYVDPAFADRMPAISEDESELLDGSGDRRANSRLSCQIPFDPALDGLAVEIAPEA
jgi:2Fe-2S ferredoxin